MHNRNISNNLRPDDDHQGSDYYDNICIVICFSCRLGDK